MPTPAKEEIRTVAELFDSDKGQETIEIVSAERNRLGRAPSAATAWEYILADQAVKSISEYFANLSYSEFQTDSWANTRLDPEIEQASAEDIAGAILDWLKTEDAEDLLSKDDTELLLARRGMIGDYVEDMYA